jgi:hypothetical protein
MAVPHARVARRLRWLNVPAREFRDGTGGAEQRTQITLQKEKKHQITSYIKWFQEKKKLMFSYNLNSTESM